MKVELAGVNIGDNYSNDMMCTNEDVMKLVDIIKRIKVSIASV